MAGNAKNVSIWWRHHVYPGNLQIIMIFSCHLASEPLSVTIHWNGNVVISMKILSLAATDFVKFPVMSGTKVCQNVKIYFSVMVYRWLVFIMTIICVLLHMSLRRYINCVVAVLS